MFFGPSLLFRLLLFPTFFPLTRISNLTQLMALIALGQDDRVEGFSSQTILKKRAVWFARLEMSRRSPGQQMEHMSVLARSLSLALLLSTAF